MDPLQRYRRVYVEITNVCNLHCSFCPTVERADARVTPETFAAVMAEVAPVTDEVALHLMGEPLGHPELAALLGVCERYATPVALTTNGLLLTGERRDLALQKIVRQVNISVHSFAANFPGRDVTPYAERVLAFVRRATATRPDLYINLRLWDLDAEGGSSPENAALRAFFGAAFGVDLAAARLDPRRRKGLPLGGRVAAHVDSRFTWPSLDLPVRATEGSCLALRHQFGVLADGTVVPCCLDKEGRAALGNMREQPLADILAGPRASAMRAGFARGELVEPLCQRCDFAKRFDRRGERQRAGAKPRVGIAARASAASAILAAPEG